MTQKLQQYIRLTFFSAFVDCSRFAALREGLFMKRYEWKENILESVIRRLTTKRVQLRVFFVSFFTFV